MAGRGPAPKDPVQRRRRNQSAAALVVSDDGALRGPELPEDFAWPPATVRWWETWRASAQAQTFTDTDWSFLLDTAVMHAEFWLGNLSLAAEVRLRVSKFGATPEDRARLRLSVDTVRPAASGLQRRAPADRQARLLKAVGDGD